MNDLAATTSIPLPSPRCEVSIRPATMDDLPFIDGLQKQHKHMVGFMRTQALAGKIKLGHVIVAEDGARRPVGYCIGNDQYYKRDDLGIIYQVNVLPVKHRSLIGATLVKAMFDRAAYGCRLFCCWCAQDLAANHFWESLGFVPLAFRAGSRGRKRLHIFWQRRIRPGDEATPHWFPSKTSGGSIAEERLAFPIPPGTHWSDAKPIVLPGDARQKQLDQPRPKGKTVKTPAPPKLDPSDISSGGLRPRPPKPATPATGEPKPKRAKAKHDPRFVAAARELRDRYLEHVNGQPLLSQGKYDVSRTLSGVEGSRALTLESPGDGAPAMVIKQLPSAA